MTPDDALRIAHALSESPRLAGIGQKLLALKSDEDLVLAMKMLQIIVPALADAESGSADPSGMRLAATRSLRSTWSSSAARSPTS